MSLIHPAWLPSARQIEVWDGRNWCARGTGIVLRGETRHILTTARHVIDERYAIGPEGREPFNRIRVRDPAFITFGPSGLDFIEWDAQWQFDESENDLAATVMPNSENGFYRAVDINNIIANDQFEALHLGHPLIMAGFPALGNAPDSEPLLVSRQGVLASQPGRDVPVPDTLGRNYFLMDSFAQSGFSGAPLFSFERPTFSMASPISISSTTINGEEVSSGSEPRRHPFPRIPAGLAGIICGHFRSQLDRSDGGHAGLSYCVPAHRIIRLMNEL